VPRPGRDQEQNVVYSVTLPSGLVATGPDLLPQEGDVPMHLPFAFHHLRTRASDQKTPREKRRISLEGHEPIEVLKQLLATPPAGKPG
jgi:hypothetical protein